DAHHIRHWADGGETRLDNLLLLCRHHHRLVHEGGYGLEKDAAGKPVFISPTGGRIPDCPETRFRGNVFALTAAHHRAGLDIGPQTPVPRWGGETMDDGMAVEGLLKRG
ncbi:MAG: HNH endonuclease signature motif containing protein, partial [Halieaceae bacterium]|nr:HNH endonuclease signature motif containing protein [Halieaceae bacterium]